MRARAPRHQSYVALEPSSGRAGGDSRAMDDTQRAWELLRALAARSHRAAVLVPVGCDIDARTRFVTTPLERAWVIARPDLARGWSCAHQLAPGAAALLDLYMPLCVGANSPDLMLAHLGQSSDGFLATGSRTAKFITGPDDIRHTHRLRALFDAVLVGASTIAADDPMLTTRLVEGRDPVRVVLDPRARLDAGHTLFQDRAARTLVVIACARPQRWPGHIETLALSANATGFDLRALRRELRALGLRRIFIEGGGETVVRFMRAGLLDRMQLVIAPITLGAHREHMLASHALLTPSWLAEQATRLRRWQLGADVLLDAEFNGANRANNAELRGASSSDRSSGPK